MTPIPECKDGTMWLFGWMFDPENMIKPIIFCPKCGGGNIGDNAPHGVRENGEVYQSMICGHPGCDFHDFVKLEGWAHGEIKHS